MVISSYRIALAISAQLRRPGMTHRSHAGATLEAAEVQIAGVDHRSTASRMRPPPQVAVSSIDRRSWRSPARPRYSALAEVLMRFDERVSGMCEPACPGKGSFL